MGYKSKYVDLAYLLTSQCCMVCDHDFMGYCSFFENKKAFIVIKPKLSYKEKIFTLAHEAGHIFYMTKGRAFIWSKKARTEKQANWFAVQLLRLMKIDVLEYYCFYEKAKKRNKYRRKSWFEFNS